MKQDFVGKFLDKVERAGNKLPDPLLLFTIVSIMILIISWVAAMFGLAVIHPVSGDTISVVNLISADGIRRILTQMIHNFAQFPPLGLVLTVMLGIGVAERTGLISAALKGFVSIVPNQLLPAAIMLAGANSSLAADAGYIVFIPLGAILFAAYGRHPLAGLAVAFAGVAGGFSANFLITALDPLLSGITTKAAQTLNPGYVVQPTANYYFMFFSCFLLAAVGSLVTTKIIEPRLGPWKSDGNHKSEPITPQERAGLKAALWVTICFVIGLLLLVVPEGAPLRNPDRGLTPFYESLIAILMFWFLCTGFVFGRKTGAIKSGGDVAKMTTESMASMGSYIVLAFVSAQFIAFFQWSNLGMIIAISGAKGLSSIGFTGLPLLLAFILVTSVADLFIGSASAKWALMGPVFVPMLMLVGISPEMTQLAYRIGDSVTNVICPLLPYLPLIIIFARRHVPNVGLGTLFSTMLPYTISFLLVWSAAFVVWYLFALPIGPDAPIHYSP